MLLSIVRKRFVTSLWSKLSHSLFNGYIPVYHSEVLYRLEATDPR